MILLLSVYGESWQSAIKDHDRNLLSFLQRCDERGVHLNSDKLQLRRKEVPFIGHVTTKNTKYQKPPCPPPKAMTKT